MAKRYTCYAKGCKNKIVLINFCSEECRQKFNENQAAQNRKKRSIAAKKKEPKIDPKWLVRGKISNSHSGSSMMAGEYYGG